MKTVFLGIHGSNLYGTNTPESDMDYKGIFIPNPRDIIAGKVKEDINFTTGDSMSKNGKDDIDHEMFSLRRFIHLACKGETAIIDMLHTRPECVLKTSSVWEYIHRNRSMFYCSNMDAYMGYVIKQASKYGVKGSRLAALREVVESIKDIPDTHMVQVAPNARGVTTKDSRLGEIGHALPMNEFCFWETNNSLNQSYYVLMGRKYMSGIRVSEFRKAVGSLWNEYGERARRAEQNNGIDWKALSHAYRGGVQLEEIMNTGDLVYPLKEKELIMKIKAGTLPFSEVRDLLEDKVETVDRLFAEAKKNGMQEQPNHEFWEEFVNDVYTDEMKKFLLNA